jgi:hypothetical protein
LKGALTLLDKILDQFPKIILAVMGMGGGVDFENIGVATIPC